MASTVVTPEHPEANLDRPEASDGDRSGGVIERIDVRGAIAQMTVRFSDHQAVVSVAGELDLVDRDLFTSLMEQVRARHPQRIVLDLADLEFLSLPLLHELERDGTGEELVVTNAYGIVKRLLDLVSSIGSQN